jgi:hypothetical protein
MAARSARPGARGVRRCRVGTRQASRLRRPLRSRGAPPGREAQRPLLLLRMPLLAAAAAAEWTSLAVGARARRGL